jgi:hypothetical protein
VDDEEFAQSFMDGSLAPARFRHRDHLRLTWLLIRQLGLEEAGTAVASGIQRFAAAHGHAERYHETLTQFWVRLVGHVMQAHPEIGDFEAFMAAFPHLLDTGLPYRHWRRETMGSAAARAHWVEPDFLALPS